MNLERNLIDNILECGVKLGRADIPICFYYPDTSLMELLGCNQGGIKDSIRYFKENEVGRLGKVTIEELADEKGRYEVKVPTEGIEWVEQNYKPTEFMVSFIGEIRRPGNTVEKIIDLFKSYSANIIVQRAGDSEWAICFADDTIDPYVYHIEQNVFGLEYHRFTKTAYRKTIGAICKV